jgi:acyl-CoA reductase-like NAD-dependent aldehyde dehydrogenase
VPPEPLCEGETKKIIEVQQPLGILAAFLPGNYPVSMLVSKLAVGSAAEDTVVSKLVPTTPLITRLRGQGEFQVRPAGLLNSVVDSGDLGGPLTVHFDMEKIQFTGSIEAGRRAMNSAAGTFERFAFRPGRHRPDAGLPAAILCGGRVRSGHRRCQPTYQSRPDVPFARIMRSGIGCESGMEGLMSLIQRKIIDVAKSTLIQPA